MLDESFNRYWPKLKARLDGIKPSTAARKRLPDEILEEILAIVRGLSIEAATKESDEAFEDSSTAIGTPQCATQ